MKKIKCPLCGTEISAYQCQSHGCPHCTAILTTDRSAKLSSVKLRVDTLLPELKNLTSRGQRVEAEELLKELEVKTLACLVLSKSLAPESSIDYAFEDNYRVVEKVREQFREWLIE